MKRGLKRVGHVSLQYPGPCTSETCPDEEGIETVNTLPFRLRNGASETCPDEEGIETEAAGSIPAAGTSETCPDEEGIETLVVKALADYLGCPSETCPDEEGIETAKGELAAQPIEASETCPDEEGIETVSAVYGGEFGLSLRDVPR